MSVSIFNFILFTEIGNICIKECYDAVPRSLFNLASHFIATRSGGKEDSTH